MGLPVVLATAFVQEGAPGRGTADRGAGPRDGAAVGGEGEPAAASVAPAPGGALRRLLTWRNAFLGGLAAFALWGMVAAGWLLLGPGSFAASGGEEEVRSDSRRSVAVLPFANMSPDEENAYFAQGIHDNVLTQLSKIRALEVKSRTSVLRYADTDMGLPEIAPELGVGAIMEGGVQRAPDQIRVNVQLIDAESDAHLWSEIYDRPYTAENVFAIQSDIAEKIAAALRAELLPEERQRIEARPTEDLEAYDLFLRGDAAYREGRGNVDLASFRRAVELYDRAIERDPGFALARAELALAQMAAWGLDQDPGRAEAARRAAEEALSADPDLADAHIALGVYRFWVEEDRDAAERAFRLALEVQPSHAGALERLGDLRYRAGAFEEGIRTLERAVELDPRSSVRLAHLARAYAFARRYPEAMDAYERSIALAPRDVSGYVHKAFGHLLWRGDVEGARAEIRRLEALLTTEQITKGLCLCGADWFRILGREYEEQLARLPSTAFGDDVDRRVVAHFAKGNLYERRGRAARAR